MKRCYLHALYLVPFLWLAVVTDAEAQPGTVKAHQKISDTEGGFAGILDNQDLFGYAITSLGDLDGDGVFDIAVGAEADDDGGNGRGAVWILFLNADGTVKSHQKISDTEGGFTGALGPANEHFGNAVTSLGDFDGDGVTDLAVGEWTDKDGGDATGAVWILRLNTDGTVKSHQKISATQGGFTGTLDNSARFGTSVASIGDLDGDGIKDLAVGSERQGPIDQGAVWILFLNIDGTVKSYQEISDTVGGFTGMLDLSDHFGASVASLGDIDGDGVIDLAVGALNDDDGGSDRGAVWILFLNADGTVKSHQKISDTEGGFTGVLDDVDFFGVSVASLGDFDGDAVPDLVAGASYDDDGSPGPCINPFLDCLRGAVWILFLNTDGTVKSHQKISDTEGGFTGGLQDVDVFGQSVVSLGDLDGDGVTDLAVGAHGDDDGGFDRGAVWVLFMNGFNAPPIADAGTDQVVLALQNVGLDGSASSDPDEDPLTFDWSFLAKPPGSLASLSDPTAVNPTFTADLPGDYVIQLLVNDGTADSPPDEVTITAQTVEEGIEDLQAAVDDLLTAGLITEKGAEKLAKELGKALKELAKGKPDKTIQRLEKFIDEVEKLVDKGELAEADGAVLIASAEALIAVLEGGAGKGGPALAGAVEGGIPEGYALSSAYPNPFNPATTIRFDLPESAYTTLTVYDVTGRMVAHLVDAALSAGSHTATFDATNLPSGVYLYRLTAGPFTKTRRMILLK